MPTGRPEFENPPEVFYNTTEARRYTVSTRVRKIQRDMTLRALELLNLPKPTGATSTNQNGEAVLKNASALLLDVGCGSGLSGDVLTEQGHAWFGVDISADMIRIAKDTELESYFAEETDEDGEEKFDPRKVRWGLITPSDEDAEAHSDRDSEAAQDEDSAAPDVAAPVRPAAPNIVEVSLNDIGQGVPFRPGTFDGCISISVIQWLCHSTKRGEVPQRRLMAFFQGLYNSLRRGAKAVLQFYPSAPEQIHMITRAAMKCGFSGGVVVDYPHSTRAKKHYLVLQAGQVLGGFVPPPALGADINADDEDEEQDEDEEYEGDDSEGSDEDAYEEAERGRKRARVAGRDRERAKRARAHSAHDTKRRRKDNRPVTGTKEWALLKKEERRRRGEHVTADTKYSLRRRKPRF